MQKNRIENFKYDLNYSTRRYYVDKYYSNKIVSIAENSSILDVGGHRFSKRGHFNINIYNLKVFYVNIVAGRQPDVLADAAKLPFKDNSFDAVICAEVLEHVYNPRQVLDEFSRVLRPGGRLLASVPFVFPLHPDPEDFSRYSPMMLERMLGESRFEVCSIEWQGGHWAVLADLIRGLAREGEVVSRWWWRPMRLISGWLRSFAIKRDCAGCKPATSYLAGFTTGFGIDARKCSGVAEYEPPDLRID